MKRLFGFAIGICLLTALASSVSAQIRRLKGPVDPVEVTRLAGHETPAALLQDDLGRVDANREIHGIMILFSQTPEQEADLAALLKAQQDPASPAYHQWLTPAQYGDRFGLNPADLAPIRDFYESQGLSVEQTATARNWLLLGGRVGDINRAFRIELHDFRTADGTHYANAASPAVPTALSGIIRSIQGLNDFRSHAPHHEFRARPSVLLSNGSHALTPFDWAVIYNVTPLYANGYDGSGQSIAVVGQSDIILSDIQGFRAQFGLPTTRVQKVLGGPFPAQSSDDQAESTLDVEWAGGVARNATIYFVYSANVNISRAFAVDQNVAPVISDSYLYCEPAVTVNPSANDYRLTALQANSQGITWLAASGDSGAAACDKGFANPVANYGIAVNLPASVPEVTAVGGTMFLEGNQYWNSSGTALTYIPETAWNEVGLGLASSGGGRSIFFTKPDWQTGTGVPNDGRRDVPDVAFSAAASDVPYAIVLNGQYESVGGTSAGTPSFAGSVAILNQYLVSKGAVARAGLGTINPTLYRLSQTNPNVFHDITTGSNIVPCNIYSQYCSAPTIGYPATRGYDLATGLGSVDINAMVSNWAPQATGTTTTLSANPTSILNTGATLLTATVRAVSGTATPSGTVTFQVSGRALGNVALSGSAGVATALLNVNGSSFSVGSSVITAVYNGATGFGASANTVTLTVTVPTAVSLVTATATPNPVYQQPANSGGYTFFYTLKLIESAGVGTTLTSFSINGTSYNAQIAQFFGTASLAARGSLSSSIQSYGFTVPGNVAFVFGGQDLGGRAWTSTLSVPFFPAQITGSMTLSVSPDIAHQNPSAAPTCQLTQQLEIQERNGLGIELTQLLASGSDQTSQIRSLFGTSRLPPYGHLTAPFCWSGPSLPQAPIYQLTGVDDVGNKIVQALTPVFATAVTGGGSFSVSANSVSLSSSGSLQATSSLNVVSTGTAPKWTATIFPANKTTSWLSISPQSNTAPGPLNVTASSTGLPNGSYAATVILESENASPHVINLPVTLTVGAVPSPNIGAVVNVAGEFGRLTNGGFATVYGTKLSNTSRGWGNSDFVGNALPTSLDNVSVLVNGKKSYINYISPGQINFLVPEDTALGDVTVQVVNGSLSSNLYPSQRTSVGPANFVYSQGGGVYPIASFPDGSPVGPTGLISSSTHPAKPGDVLALWMSGLGPTSPAYGGGQIIHSPLNTAVAPILTVGGVRATLDFAGLVGAGLYQVNFHVPQVANGDQPIAFSVNGVLAQTGLLLTVHN